MTHPDGISLNSHPRPQAERILRRIAPDGPPLRAVLLGQRREGKTDLLRQLQNRLLETAEGPIPFFYSFAGPQNEAALARSFVASFCQQVRAFLMRQEEMLLEPAAALESELERAGLPLSLSEMIRKFLALNESQQCEQAGTLLAQFANREGRPLFLLLDDSDALPPTTAILAGLDSPYLSWLLAGRLPFVSRLAGARAWPVLRLEPFSREDALAIAKKNCRTSGITFFEQVWDQWCAIAGSSAWQIEILVLAAAAQEQPLESIEQLCRVYVRELSSGTIGNWLAWRLQQAVPGLADRAAAVELLSACARGLHPSSMPVLNARLAESLIAEEWAEETPAGPRIALEPVQRDWLLAAAAAPHLPLERSETRAYHQILMRVRREATQRGYDPVLDRVRAQLLKLPETGLPNIFDIEWLATHSPRILDVTAERSGSAELFWCHGTQSGGGGLQETPFVLLIIACTKEPAVFEVENWRRQLEEEIRLLHSGSAPGAPAGHELWLLVRPGTPLDAVRSERRFEWDTFAIFCETNAEAGKGTE